MGIEITIERSEHTKHPTPRPSVRGVRPLVRLGRKGRPSDADWQALWERHAEIVSDARMQTAIDRALRRIEQARTQFGPRTGMAWSGGKDSVVIHHLAGRLGIAAGVYVAPEPLLEYADFRAWLSIHQPPGVRSIYNGLSLDWLKAHPQCLFPDRFSGERRAAGIQAWNAFKWRGQRQYVREGRLDFLILGRRTIDGNVVGTGGVHQSRDGFIAVNPIFDWSHEETIAYLRRHDLPLAPVYRLPGGFRKGPRAWPMTTLEQVLAREPSLYDQHRAWIDAALTETGGANEKSSNTTDGNCANSAVSAESPSPGSTWSSVAMPTAARKARNAR